MSRFTVGLTLAALLMAWPTVAQGQLRAQVIATGLTNPVAFVVDPLDHSTFYAVEQRGTIRIVRNNVVSPAMFLDLRSEISAGGERGLLGMAFAPDAAMSRRFYVNFTNLEGHTVIARYTRAADGAVDPNSRFDLMWPDGRRFIEQPFSNHNGGHLAFGPDGYLYIGMGDGGAQGDPHGNGQNRNALLGKLLRLNVDRGDPYTVPASNPYARNGEGRGEIWAIGLRNPWRFAFDRRDGLLYIADVGQNSSEEINVVPYTKSGLNYGWNVMEGAECYRLPLCNQSAKQPPALTYSHSDGSCSVIGGFVYRGRKLPEIQGHYFYSDYCNSRLRSFRFAAGRVQDEREWPVAPLGTVVSFGEDGAGELYLLSQNGRVYRLVAGKAPE